jgi:hypothetical protein
MVASSGRTLAGWALVSCACAVQAGQIDLPVPPGSVAFGDHVAVLPNGNIVVVDPEGPVTSVGAVYLFAPDGSLISTLTGSASEQFVGSGGITVLANGNFVVRSPFWDNGAVLNVGAITFFNGETGRSGVVSSTNSLVGGMAADNIGSGGVVALPNGNYVVVSPLFRYDAAIPSTGAVTLANGATGRTGTVTALNSRVGTQASDRVGSGGVTVLANGHYVISSPMWDLGSTNDVGAVTWVNGVSGGVGAVTAANSFTGTTANDRAGSDAVVALSNGNYVFASSLWDNSSIVNAGAATWCNGSAACSGQISAANSIVGSTTLDQVGQIVALSNGNYVVVTQLWDNGPLVNAGAATWGNGMTGVAGAITGSNSLVGSNTNDRVGTVRPLTNGNYVVASHQWNASQGAATWSNGATGRTGVITPGNSLVGAGPADRVGLGGVLALSNGNYVVVSEYWDNGAASNVGAVTWGNGATGIVGPVTTDNSLVGSTAEDGPFSWSRALSNGDYVVAFPGWDDGALQDVGAVTRGDGNIGLAGTISPATSMIGTSTDDRAGLLTPLDNGGYVVGVNVWDAGALENVGLVQAIHGDNDITGPIDPVQALTGTNADDQVGAPVTAHPGGYFVVENRSWGGGVGAITLGRSHPATRGKVDAGNSVIGTAPNGGASLRVAFDPHPDRRRLVVGRPEDNRVTILTLDALFADGFE